MFPFQSEETEKQCQYRVCLARPEALSFCLWPRHNSLTLFDEHEWSAAGPATGLARSHDTVHVYARSERRGVELDRLRDAGGQRLLRHCHNVTAGQVVHVDFHFRQFRYVEADGS